MGPAGEHRSPGLRDPGWTELVRAAARAPALRVARQAALLLTAAALIGCGGGSKAASSSLGWDGAPTLRASSSGARVLIGKVKNESGGKLTIKAPDVRVVDQDGRRIKSSVTFISAYVRSKYPHNAGVQSEPGNYPVAEQKRVGFLAEIGAGKTAPLTVSWEEPPGRRTASRIELGGASLAIPAQP